MGGRRKLKEREEGRWDCASNGGGDRRPATDTAAAGEDEEEGGGVERGAGAIGIDICFPGKFMRHRGVPWSGGNR